MSQLSAVPGLASSTRAAPFECTLSKAGRGAAWVHVAGALDPLTSPQLERALRAAQLHAQLIVPDEVGVRAQVLGPFLGRTYEPTPRAPQSPAPREDLG